MLGNNYDVVIVGCGMVGLAISLALAKAGFNVSIIDKQQIALDWDEASYALRVSAISKASQSLFDELGVWQNIVDTRISPYEHMFVWDANSTGKIELNAADINTEYLGYIIENRVIQKALYTALSNCDNVNFYLPDQCENFDYEDPTWSIELQSGKKINTGLLLAADGANSMMRTAVGIKTDTVLYDQSALVCTVNTEKPHDCTARQRFLSAGPLALLPLADPNYCSVVWSTDVEQAQELLALSKKDFNAAITEASEGLLGKLKVIGDRVAFPLKHQHAADYVKPGFALLGDAAHAIHPLAGQGVNQGFLDVKAMMEVLVAAKSKSRPLGLLSDLKRYERSRRWHNSVFRHSMTIINGMFSNDNKCLADIRALGLNFVDKQKFAKQFFIKQAMGE